MKQNIELITMLSPSKQTIANLKKKVLFDHENIEYAREYAQALYSFLLDNDESHTLSYTKKELSCLHSVFPTDERISENYASCLVMWVYGKSISTYEKVRKQLFQIRSTFPKSEEIAEDYSEILVLLSREESSMEKCGEYLHEITQLKKQFSNSSIIQEGYNEIMQASKNLNEYWDYHNKSLQECEKFYNNPCIDNATNYAEALCDLASLEKDEAQCRKHMETVKQLSKAFPNSIDLIEFQTEIMYYHAATQGYEAMRKASRSIYRILKRFPSDEGIVENYVLTLDYISEDEKDIESLVHRIKEYHTQYPSNQTIASSYASVLSLEIEEQSPAKRKETMDTIWELVLQYSESKDVFDCFIAAFNRYCDVLFGDSHYPFFNYSPWLEKNALQVDRSTGEIVREYESILDACKETKTTPIDILDSITNTSHFDKAIEWFVP